MLNPQLSSTNFAASTLAYSLPSTKVETQSPLRRRSQIHPLYVNHFESPPYSAFTTGAVNWDLYPDQLKEAVAGLEVLGEPYLKELQALVSTTSRQLISHTSVPRCNFTEHARHQYLYPVHLHNFGSVLPTATQNKASPCQIKGVEHLPSSGVTASNCDRRFSHNTPIRNLAALQYLQNPPSKHDLITCTVKESEAVAGEKDGETLEEIEDGWTKPAVCRNERELKRQAYALLGERYIKYLVFLNIDRYQDLLFIKGQARPRKMNGRITITRRTTANSN